MRFLREIPRAFRALVIVPPLYGIDWYTYLTLVILQAAGVIDWPWWALGAPLAAGFVADVVYHLGAAYDRRAGR